MASEGATFRINNPINNANPKYKALRVKWSRISNAKWNPINNAKVKERAR